MEYITNPDFRVPTTIAKFEDSLYAVNARFDLAEPTADTEYEVVRVGIDTPTQVKKLTGVPPITTVWGGIKMSY
ncbi:hypothetical protein GF312_21250 [Candidatus Poribacteria bacterium]|nr:hypothetical protein [Candidatus Poribacteria bacterium]